jgi:putative tricarboxylic transport membrane protein
MIGLNRDSGACLFFLASGAGICLWSLQYGLGTLAAPGPGFMGLCAGASVCLFSIIGLFANRGIRKGDGKLFGHLWRDSLLILLLLVGFALLLNFLGFMVCTFLFLIILVGRKKTYSWPMVLALSVGPSIVMYIVFEVWLQANLPKGLLGYLGW